jgi:hypothetical protein
MGCKAGAAAKAELSKAVGGTGRAFSLLEDPFRAGAIGCDGNVDVEDEAGELCRFELKLKLCAKLGVCDVSFI